MPRDRRGIQFLQGCGVAGACGAKGEGEVCGSPLKQALHGAIRGCQCRGDVKEVKIGLIVDDRTGDRDTDGAAHVAHHVEEPARVSKAIGW